MNDPETKLNVAEPLATAMACPQCGTPRQEWVERNGEGVPQNGKTYCSTLCSDNANDVTSEVTEENPARR